MSGRCTKQLILLAGLTLAACYEPTFAPCTISCALDDDPCPAGLECSAGLCAAPGGACIDTSAPYHRQIAAGADHACALVDNAIYCWGANTIGQLALPLSTPDSNPVEVTPPAGASPQWIAIVAGAAHTCALEGAATPEVYCWGDDTSGQRGDVATSDPLFFQPTRPATARWIGIGAGDRHTCAIAEDVMTLAHSVHCWGANEERQLGGGVAPTSATPVAVTMPQARRWRMVEGGAGHTCVVSSEAEVTCWGDNARGQLGRDGADPAAADVAGRFAVVAAGADHTCAITTGGVVQCWGDNPGDMLGLGSAQEVITAPTAVLGGAGTAGWSALDTAPRATCGVRAGQTLCWGDDHPQAGLGTLTRGQAVPDATVEGAGTTAIDVAVTASSACSHEGARNVQCWGDNPHRELGTGPPTIQWTPIDIGAPPGTSWQTVRLGADGTCAVARDAANNYTTRCWGRNGDRQIPTSMTEIADVVTAPYLQDTASLQNRRVAIGERHVCAVYDTGAPDVDARCWGDDSLQQNPGVAAGTAFSIGLSSTPEITADRHFTCVTGTDTRQPMCWGTAGAGTIQPTPTAVATNIVLRPQSVVWGYQSGCGFHHIDGTIWCFGTESVGELGNGGAGPAAWPLAGQAMTLTGITRMARGPGRTRCAANAGIGIWCWGDNASGQVDPTSRGGTREQPVVTVAPAAVTNLGDVTVGGSHGCAVFNGGNSLQCWGGFEVGQRTRLPTTAEFGPITNPSPGVTTWTAVSAGGSHTCAIADGSRLLCWGRNTYGQIGNGISGRASAAPIALP